MQSGSEAQKAYLGKLFPVAMGNPKTDGAYRKELFDIVGDPRWSTSGPNGEDPFQKHFLDLLAPAVALNDQLQGASADQKTDFGKLFPAAVGDPKATGVYRQAFFDIVMPPRWS